MQWGAEADYPGDNWEYHLKPFRAAVNCGVRWVGSDQRTDTCPRY